MKLGQIFDSHRNALNAMRLIMASEVIFCHSFVLPGHVLPPAPLLQLMSDVGVDGFFALSGFLITASWLNHPRVRDYLIARALRILPAFYVCLVITAFVFAPIGVAIQGGPAGQLLRSSAPFDFVAANSAVFITKLDVGGTPTGIPMSGYWNGNLWTLFFEVLCYLAVAALGIARLANRRWTSAAIVAVATLCVPFLQLLPPTPPGAINGYQVLTRFALMFAAGAVMYQWKHVIPARWSLVAVSVIIVLAASLLPDYRLVGALPLAYAVVVPGALIRNKHLRLPTDLSYGFYIYGFPVQQVLVISGLINLNPFAFAVISTIATLPLAALSWFVIEKPAMSLKSRLKKKWATAEAGRPDAPVSTATQRPLRQTVRGSAERIPR